MVVRGPGDLAGYRVLVVEDDYHIASELTRVLQDVGAVVIGPVAKVQQALAKIDATKVDLATLDVHLGTEKVYPVADVLMARGIPFVFTTGYGSDVLPRGYAHIPYHDKPVDFSGLILALSKFVPKN
jgi:two-component SAPR family response regulator